MFGSTQNKQHISTNLGPPVERSEQETGDQAGHIRPLAWVCGEKELRAPCFVI
jgi:hypothetical protein